ncbi:uncharacterized protein [Leptinotarsa decemlineata]|uniref:uncharacterized protein n=1 Tax=Leptinotarsa decemlineata TaxID=7539 RepID=UPI003D308371
MAYKTASADFLNVITGIPPIDLLVEERRRLDDRETFTEEVRAEERNRTIGKWQQRWTANTSTAQWTKRLIPNLKPWLDCKFKNLEYFVTQALTGHGSFGSFTYRIGKTADVRCRYCQADDDPQHTILSCPRWHSARHELEASVGDRVSPDNFVG